MIATQSLACEAKPAREDSEPSASSAPILTKEVTVAAPVADVWKAWTTNEGIAAWFVPDCNVELKIGGPYELYMGMKKPDESGLRGSEGCKVLSYIPHEMLAFEWAFPPAVMSLRKARAKTQVVLLFEEVSPRETKVHFAQLGWQAGDDWDAGYAYFDKAWSSVLTMLKDHFDTGKRDSALGKAKRAGKDAGESHPKPNVSRNGLVTVSIDESPVKKQSFEMMIDVPVQRVWRALATTEGFRELLLPQAEIELKPGGKYATWPGATNKVMAFWPMRMLSTSGSAPKQFPNVRKGGTWSAYFFEPLGERRTRLRLVCVGWQEGEEWDRAFAYFIKNNPVFLNHLHDNLMDADKKAPAGGGERP